MWPMLYSLGWKPVSAGNRTAEESLTKTLQDSVTDPSVKKDNKEKDPLRGETVWICWVLKMI